MKSFVKFVSRVFAFGMFSASLLSGLLLFSPSSARAQTLSFTGTGTPVDFGNVNLCAAGKTTPAPCSKTLVLSYKVAGSGTLGATKVVTWGSPNLDFTAADGGTCTGRVTDGETCTVKVTFAPLYAGSRPGAALVFDDSGKVLATTRLVGNGVGAQIAFNPGLQVPLPSYTTGYVYEPAAINGAGDLFYTNSYEKIIELPNGGGASVVLPELAGSFGPAAIDGAGDLFVMENQGGPNGSGLLHEAPAGGGAEIDTPMAGEYGITFGATADGAGDIFVAEDFSVSSEMVELPVGGSLTTLPFPKLISAFVAVDGLGDVFDSSEYDGLYELPAAGGQAKHLNIGLANGFYGYVAADAIGDVFDMDQSTGQLNEVQPGSDVPLQVTSFNCGGLNTGLSINSAGDLFTFVCNGLVEVKRSEAAPLNFGTVTSGASLTKTTTISNVGTAPLTLNPSFSGSSFRIASTQPDNCLESTPSGRSCTLNIVFSPTEVGAASEVLSLATNAVNNPDITLEGVGGVPVPVLSLVEGFYPSAQSVSITDADSSANIYYTTNGVAPTASSTKYTGPITVSSSERISAIAVSSGLSSGLVSAGYTVASSVPAAAVVNFNQGFAEAASSLQFNGNAKLDGDRLELTDGRLAEISSAFTTAELNVQKFTTYFTFQLTNAIADGFTFTIQNAGTGALGGGGQGLGYNGIDKSVAIKFDLHNNSGEGNNSIGIYCHGASPTVPSIDLTGSGINLHSGDAMAVRMTYDGTKLLVKLTDTVTGAAYTHDFPIDIPTVIGSTTAHVGFTASTGARAAQQEIASWTYVAGSPAALVPLPSTPPYGDGFTAEGLFTNGEALLSGTELHLIANNGTWNAEGSAWYQNKLNIQAFTTDFTFDEQTLGYGLTFTIQNDSNKALGKTDQGLGYQGIGQSVALKFEFDQLNKETYEHDSTGLYINGVSPSAPALDMTSSNVNPGLSNPIHVHLVYDGTTLTLTATDPYLLATYSHSFTIDIPTVVGGETAYVGFTGANGSYKELGPINVLNWSFTNP